jgi:hypothetical protein
VLREWVENSVRLKEQMEAEIERRESEMLQKFGLYPVICNTLPISFGVLKPPGIDSFIN